MNDIISAHEKVIFGVKDSRKLREVCRLSM